MSNKYIHLPSNHFPKWFNYSPFSLHHHLPFLLLKGLVLESVWKRREVMVITK
ncbi:hypothetical protein Pint_21537 [Pistacia integerrima]|uniref:Uncharacterized protein n=1 Tax=Pistacia integerrima TaxID=434235 RepID=A0ACC0XD40_9ROSI|nr:hypothetical protein Pint_21537 [Pistacia integerrima]